MNKKKINIYFVFILVSIFLIVLLSAKLYDEYKLKDDINTFKREITIEDQKLSTNKNEGLISLNEEYQNVVYMDLINKIYPVGTVYMTTTEATVQAIQNKFGGTWESYSAGKSLIGANSTYTNNSTGGISSVTLSSTNLPSHSHSIPAVSTTTSASGAHTPTLYTRVSGYTGWSYSSVTGNLFKFSTTLLTDGDGGKTKIYNSNAAGTIVAEPVSDHTHTITSSATTSVATGSGTSINIQNPYTAVYMYKRTA